MAKYQRNEGHVIAHQLMELARATELAGSDLWVLAKNLDGWSLDVMDHDEYMRAKKALKKMIKMTQKALKAMPSTENFYNEMEETNNDKT